MRKGVWLTLILAASAFAYTVQVDTADLQVKAVEDPAFLGYDAVNLEGSYALPTEAGEPFYTAGHQDRSGGDLVRGTGNAPRHVPRNAHAGAHAGGREGGRNAPGR
jgi:hypothetical protein